MPFRALADRTMRKWHGLTDARPDRIRFTIGAPAIRSVNDSDAGSMDSPASGGAGCPDNPPGPKAAARHHSGRFILRATTMDAST